MRDLLKRAYTEVERPRWLILACVAGILLCLLYRTDFQTYSSPSHDRLVATTDAYLRFANTAVQAALPVLLADKIGMVQLVYVAIGTTVATHGLKRLVDGWVIDGVRMGERPSGLQSRYNMPSGHSSMASCAAYFVSRRYGWMHALYLVPILLLTMYARVALDAHTVSAVIAGALVGIMMAAVFTSRRKASPGRKPAA